jgi:hypothetical protein
MDDGMRRSSLPCMRRIGQETRAMFARLSNRCRRRSALGRKGKFRRAISTRLVKVLNAASPATGRREARSMATAPPSDQPTATIARGSMSRRDWRCS